MTRPLGMCGACREADCECCDLLVWGGPCDCGCVVDEPPRKVLVFLSKPRMATPPRKPRDRCRRGHELVGDNVYQEAGSSKRRCWECRRASWRRYQYRRTAGEVA